MNKWSSHSYPISELRNWSNARCLEIQPSFQRRELWSLEARKMLIDSILQNIPIPKIYLSTKKLNTQTYRVVIDGQQRISAILDFLRDKYLISFNEIKNCYFSELPKEYQEQFLSYQIDYNEGLDMNENELREMYSRINKYSFALNKQELRRADYPGTFLKLIGKLTGNQFLDKIKLFSIGNRKRFGDAEFISELLAGMLGGIQDEKKNLDAFYIKYAEWNKEEKKECEHKFLEVIKDLEYLNTKFDISKSCFRNKANFYSLFFAIYALQKEGYSILDKDITPLINDLKILDINICPEAEFLNIFQDYALKTLVGANSKQNREWCSKLLYEILSGSYKNKIPENETYDILLEMKTVIDENGVLYEDSSMISQTINALTWEYTQNYQVSNSILSQ